MSHDLIFISTSPMPQIQFSEDESLENFLFRVLNCSISGCTKVLLLVSETQFSECQLLIPKHTTVSVINRVFSTKLHIYDSIETVLDLVNRLFLEDHVDSEPSIALFNVIPRRCLQNTHCLLLYLLDRLASLKSACVFVNLGSFESDSILSGSKSNISNSKEDTDSYSTNCLDKWLYKNQTHLDYT